MGKKFTDEELEKFASSLVGKMDMGMEMDEDFCKAQNLMWAAEKTLLESLDEHQRALYEAYCEKREDFYDIANTRILELL